MKASASNRVLMLVENNPYPQDSRVHPEARALVAAGYQVSVISPADSGQPWREVLNGVRVYRFPAPPPAQGFLGYLWEYGYSLTATFFLSLLVFWREGFDVIHTANPPDTFVLVVVLYKLLGKRFIFDHHDLCPEMYYARFEGKGNRLVHGALVWLEKLSCKLADHVIATNKSYKALEMERGNVPEERITIVRNGPDVTRLRLTEPDPALRQKARIIIGYAGVMGAQDGVDYLLRALRHLVVDLGRRDFFCIVVGKGDMIGRLKKLATELELDSYVWFTGYVPVADYRRYLSTMDICVDPDPSNPFNDRSTMTKVMDYMAMGKPTVAFDLPEHRFTAQHAALYVRPNDELELARAVVQLMDDPGRRQAMGSFGRERVQSELAWHHSVPQLLAAYRKVLPVYQYQQPEPTASLRPVGSGPWRKIHKFAHWLSLRTGSYVAGRLLVLLRRYGISSTRAKRRALACVKLLAHYDCRPTFPTPGRVVRRHAKFSRELQGLGAELAVHGYDHVDFRSLSPEEARGQFIRAAHAFQASGIQMAGFRCPYLSYSDDLTPSVPTGLFGYSSNKALWWDVVTVGSNGSSKAIFDGLSRFYRAESSQTTPAVPRIVGNLVEIPVSLPDDLQLCDGLKLDDAGMGEAWAAILSQTYRRGELFVLMFHPESFERCNHAFEGVLQEARKQRPGVWVTQLREVSRWWREKCGFTVDVTADSSGLHLRFHCSERTTILTRHLEAEGQATPWQGTYRVLRSRSLRLATERLPFVGVSAGTSLPVVSFLKEQGYIVKADEDALRCALYLDTSTLAKFGSQLQLIDHIESSPVPLVRFWRWPDENRSALCLTGDLDALSLVDYASRLLTI